MNRSVIEEDGKIAYEKWLQGYQAIKEKSCERIDQKEFQTQNFTNIDEYQLGKQLGKGAYA